MSFNLKITYSVSYGLPLTVAANFHTIAMIHQGKLVSQGGRIGEPVSRSYTNVRIFNYSTKLSALKSKALVDHFFQKNSHMVVKILSLEISTGNRVNVTPCHYFV